MRASQYYLKTLKETPADAEVISHRLMLRAGMMRKVAAGIYTWLPLGLRVLKKIENIVREEMNRAGALEILMPNVQPTELWQESGRLEQYGPELLRFLDRHQREFCFGPTHEEVVTDVVRDEVRSYKDLPLNLYQIQTKFRDEIRPRFGVMRGREFLMKDAYSFHIDQASLNETYQLMYETYCKIFQRLQLDFRAVIADTGSIGGEKSHEFQVLAKSGEDIIAYSNASDYAANIELASGLDPGNTKPTPSAAMQMIDTPGLYTIQALADQLNIPATQSVKTLFVHGTENNLIGLILRGDHELNLIKAEKIQTIKKPFTFATDLEIEKAIGARPGSLGPVNLKLTFYVDRDAAVLADFCCGANINDKHFINVNWERDVKLTEVLDLRNVIEGEKSPDGKGQLQFVRGIEVGHIFQLGDKYSKAMGATVLNEAGKATVMQMGCYGLGVSRTVAAAIEQNHDEKGIIWPESIAPFQIAILPMNLHKSDQVKAVCEKLYADLQQAGFEVLFDDRKERAGVMFADMELIGIPHLLIVGERNLEQNKIEYKKRSSSVNHLLEMDQVIAFLKK